MNTIITSTWETIIQYFFPVFTAPTAEIFLNLVTGWVLCTAGKEKDDFFFTTDLSLTAAEVISGFAGRWSTEDTFKNTRQFIGGQEPQTWKGKGPERAAALSLWLYSAVWLWYLGQKSKRRYFFVQPWYPGKSAASFADALRCLRRVLWRDRIKFMFGKRLVHNKNFELLIEALASAA